ncbi:hypothetical protein TRAPUB_13242 [Trametes pubescens]|uniref:Uncharacterized protein n=1 Tax=Trametes pubescens TaxID=154538 RepID=A0A1M2VRL0_TRAPU|nr:hypothetical protein TRAPUB_13242 [Trametes pubescens]
MRSRSHVFSRIQADEGVSGTSSGAHPLDNGSSHDARYGSAATSLEPSPSSRPPLIVHADPKDCVYHTQELQNPLPSIPVPPSMPVEQVPDTTWSVSDIHATLQGVTTAAPEQETAEVHTSERFLHLTLPWVFGQRVLAMMAGEDVHSVGSNGSEPLPAYEPRR